MNREIKFRTWDRQNKQFAEWTNRDPFFDTSSGRIFFWERVRREDGSYDGDIILQDFGDRFVLQQYTGLQDSDGKDIYEGDILEYTYNVGCFRFSNGKLLRGCIPSNEIIQEKINQQVKWQGAQFIGIHPVIKIGYTLVDKKPQVIGNIFETPELIEINDHNNQTDS